MIFKTAGVLNRWCHKNDIISKGYKEGAGREVRPGCERGESNGRGTIFSG